MKRLAMILISLTITISCTSASAWMVGKTGLVDFTSIQAAVDDARVVSGDTIRVLPGVYQENLLIPACKQLVVQSVEGYESTIIRRPQQPSNGPKMTVLIQSQSIFEGFTVDDPVGESTGPIELADVPGPGDMPENTAAITLTGPALVLHNRVKGHRFGILQECPSGALGLTPSIRFNICDQNDIGICCCETYSEIRDNIVVDNHWVGILSAHASCDDIVNNLITHNGTSGRDFSSGILCWQSYDWRMYDLTPRIALNTITANEGDGIVCIWEMGGANRPIIEHSIITANTGCGVRAVAVGDPAHLPKPRIYRCNLWGNLKHDIDAVDRIVDCISVDPMFTQEYQLRTGSPCIDRGGLPTNWGTASEAGTDRNQLDLGFHYPPRVITPKTLIE